MSEVKVTPELLAEWERITNKTTSDDWWTGDPEHWHQEIVKCGDKLSAHKWEQVAEFDSIDDAAFCVAARTAVPALIARIRELEAFVKAYDEWSNDESGLMGDTFDNMISAREAIKP